MQNKRVLTVIEVLIILIVVAIAVVIVTANVRRARIAANEASCIGSLRTIAIQQGVAKAQVEVDQDLDGVGGYAFLDEIVGEVCARKHRDDHPEPITPVSPVYLPAGFRTGGGSCATMGGYVFRLYLPGIGKDSTGKGPDAICDLFSDGTEDKYGTPYDPDHSEAEKAAIDLQEKTFVVQAWPVRHRRTGQRCFCVTEAGAVYGSKMTSVTYSGRAADGGNEMDSFELCFSQQPADKPIWERQIASGPDDPAMDTNIYLPCGN